MQKLLVVLYAVTLTGISSADDSVVGLSQACWMTDGREDFAINSITFCVDGESVEAAVFYPNRGHNSTTCRSRGRVEAIDSATLAIRLQQGSCENGRTLAATDFTCTLLNEYELNCLDSAFNQVHLKRDTTETAETNDR